MGYKCTPQILGLTRGNPKNAKHRANGGNICREHGEERYSKSETLDRTRSYLNEYGGSYGQGTGQDCWGMLKQEAEEYRMPVTLPNGGHAERGLRKDAVIGYAMIINPPDEMCAGWDRDTYDKFYRDSVAAMSEIEPRLFRADTVRMYSIHRDEGLPDEDGHYGEHIHITGAPRDASGRYCGNLIDAKLLSEINREFPAMMRSKGWDLDDLDVTDWERYKTDPVYKAKQDKKRRNHGKSTNDYIAAQNRKTKKTLDGKECSLNMWEEALQMDQEDFDTEVADREAQLQKQEEKMSLRYMKHRARKQDERDEEQDHREEEQDERERQLDEQEHALDARGAALTAQEAQIDRKRNLLEKDIETVSELKDRYKNGIENLEGDRRIMSRKLTEFLQNPSSTEAMKLAVDFLLKQSDKIIDRHRSSSEEAEARTRQIIEDDVRKKYEQTLQNEFGP